MNSVMSKATAKLNSNRKRKMIWQRAVRVMAVIVVFCTTYALILPAITLHSEAICGKEVHTHTEKCYQIEQTDRFYCEFPAEAIILHQHDAFCLNEAGERICTLDERTEHVHDESCYPHTEVLNCPVTHVHGEECAVKTRELICTVTEEEHSHTDECYTERITYCDEPAVEDHTHDPACYMISQEPNCGREELRLHAHDIACMDTQGTMICILPQVINHVHSEACRNSGSQPEKKLICGKEEHEHSDSCYPLEEEAVIGTEYHCGYTGHSHDEQCYAPDGTMTCTIPEHTHDTLCLIDNLDLNADLETAEQWEETLEDVELTGIWADDLIAVAESQLGYMESRKNCILYQDELLGYTRYGAWYGNDYGKWDDMFISFCLNYAEIDEDPMPRESDTSRWVTALTERGLYSDVDSAVPAPGDLVFMDTNEDDKADFVGILVEMLPENEIRIIAGDTVNNCVAYETRKLAEDGILGFCDLPENPDPQAGAKTDVTSLLAGLPEVDVLKQTLNGYQQKGDRETFYRELKNLTSQLETIRSEYDTLSAEEKAQVTVAEKLTALLEVCSTVTWREIPALSTDEALVTALREDAAQIISSQPVAEGETASLRNQDFVAYQFSVETKAHDGESTFSSARVKVELVLPLTADKAVFDTSAMNWLEDSKFTVETRTIGEKRVNCQVLTGVKNLTPADGSFVVIPGSFTETVKVNVLNAAHGDQVFVQISAAMEQNDWNGTCWLHQTEEKQTIQTTAYTVDNALLGADEAAVYDSFKTRIEAVALENLPEEYAEIAADEIHTQLDLAYLDGKLSIEHYKELYHLVWSDIYEDPNSVAESAVGNLRKYTSWTSPALTPKNEKDVPLWEGDTPIEMAASPMRMFKSVRSVPTSSNSQIIKNGGAANGDNVIFVSKTIDGTEQENVFDITLNITTVERIEEVIEEPNMAVVIVMDISQTMNTTFGDSGTRYDAAMTAATQFINEFRQNAGEVSQVGYVAFNTDAHEIFDLSRCDTQERADALIQEMKDETEVIIGAEKYDEAHTRFTNIEADLKMGADMLKDAPPGK